MPASRAILHDIMNNKLKPHVEHVVDSHTLHLKENITIVAPVEHVSVSAIIELDVVSTTEFVSTSTEEETSIDLVQDVVLEIKEETKAAEIHVVTQEIPIQKKRNPFKKKVETT